MNKNWAASSEFGTYRLCEQRRFRRACASAQSRQNLRCLLIQAVRQEEPSDRKPDPWPLSIAGHVQLKFVMTECSKTQIRLTRHNWYWCSFIAQQIKIQVKTICQQNEPPRDKTNKMALVPSEDSDQPGYPLNLIRVFAVRMKKPWVLSYPLSTQRRLWSDWEDAQADLSLRWAEHSLCWFCHDAAQISDCTEAQADLSLCYLHMSLVTTKPVFGIFDQVRLKLSKPYRV